MKKRFFRSALLGLAAAVMAVTPVAPVMAAVGVTLDPGAEHSIGYRQFNFYRLFAIKPGTAGENVEYIFDPATKAAVQAFVGKQRGKAPAEVTEMEAVDYIASITTRTWGGGRDHEGGGSARLTERQIEDPASRRAQELRKLNQELKSQNTTPQYTLTGSTGAAKGQTQTLSGVVEGYYFIDEDTTNTAANTPASSFVARLLTENMTIQLKSVDTPILQKQIFEDDNGIGWNDIADADRGQTILYRSTFNIPAIGAYEKYEVTYQDKLNNDMIFDPASVKVSITDGSDTRTLSKGDHYTISTAGSAEETFSIHFPDLKALSTWSSDPTYQYGQQVIIEYASRMSENKTITPGRPGMENAARLKYSSDPEDVSRFAYTPWDSVVAFSFGMNFTVYNYRNYDRVPNTQFKLYRDEAATEEVLFKKDSATSQYLVIHSDAAQKGAVPDSTPLTADFHGTIQVVGLDQGTYYLKEVGSPSGFYPLTDPIKVTVTPAYSAARNSYVSGQGAGASILTGLTGTGNIVKFNTGTTPENVNVTGDPTAGTVHYTIYKRPVPQLPLTGSQSTMIAMGAGVLMIAVGACGMKKSRKKQ